MSTFRLATSFSPRGDQPAAIDALADGARRGLKHQVLLGVTGSGKTFTIANIVERLQRPALVIAPNKTLAAQLFFEFKELFPGNAVEYFVSYYDYYQPEAYIPATDTYIEKDSSINEEIEKLRHRATYSLLERRDTIIVASVSCIYGIGSPDAYQGMVVRVGRGQQVDPRVLMYQLIAIQYARNDYDFFRGTFRVRGDALDIFPAYEDKDAIHVQFFGDEVEEIYKFDPLTGEIKDKVDSVAIYPASHYVTPEEKTKQAIHGIRMELKERLAQLEEAHKLLEAQRLKQRTLYDIEIMEEMGYCKGIENYSRHLDGRPPGTAPFTLLDYFPPDFLLFIDESHLTIPQLNAMYAGDRSRKENLVEHGFRLPCAMDNRPLKFTEFEARESQVVYVSATPGPYERGKAEAVVEQIIRPTGLVDPEIVIRPATTQVDDLVNEIRQVVERGERTLVTTLTKRMAEDLTDYLAGLSIKAVYLHSDVETMERVKIINALRRGDYDVLVGINLLREGLDMPEVSLVAILDADREGFLRSETSLIQTCGRAARNVHGRVIFYADAVTPSMDRAMQEANRRRAIQQGYNDEHGITPRTIVKNIQEDFGLVAEMDYVTIPVDESKAAYGAPDFVEKRIVKLEKEMKKAAKELQFEKAAKIRDEIKKLRDRLMDEL